MRTTWGPGAISNEDARLVAHVSISIGRGGEIAMVEAVTRRD
ncbi:hypothetical protein [Aeoliella sp.]